MEMVPDNALARMRLLIDATPGELENLPQEALDFLYERVQRKDIWEDPQPEVAFAREVLQTLKASGAKARVVLTLFKDPISRKKGIERLQKWIAERTSQKS